MVHKKTSLARDFAIFSAIILLTVLLFSICVGLLIHYSYHNKQEAVIANKINLLNRELNEDCNFIAHYASFLGNKIINADNKDPTYIARIFSAESFPDLSSNNAWNIFSWVKPNKKMILSRFDGTPLEEYDVSMYTHLDKTPIHPNILQFSIPTTDVLNNQWVIPVGVDLKDHGVFLGTINTSFNLERLVRSFETIFNRTDLVFMLLDNNFNFVLSSRNINFSHAASLPPVDLIQQIKNSILKTKLDKGSLENKIDYGKFSFTYFQHSERYPFYFVVGEDIMVANSQYWQITFPRIIELTIMGMLFIILLYYFRQQIVKPIVLLAESAKKIAAGDANVKIHYDTKYNEVNLLADQLLEIQNTKEQLLQAKHNVEKINDNLESKVQERTLELKKALAIKTEFLNNISHEVRTPVQGITTLAQGLIENWHNHNEEKKFALASAVASNSQRLFSLVSNLLDLSLFNSGKMHFNAQNTDLIVVINDIVIECNNLYLHNKPIKISFVDHPTTAVLSIDAEKISQVLRNLITNSIKFMDEGKISISVKSPIQLNKDPVYTITIYDEGIHIPEIELESIFTPFTQSTRTKNKITGAGLGLSICKQIINGHHGKITAKNNQEKGVSVSFTLPIIQENIQLKQLPDLKPINSNSPQLIYILMIDDEPTCQMSMDILLSHTNYSLISEYGGISGLQYLRKNYNKIDIIFLDLMMPDMYGLNVLSEIKASPELRDIPVIIQSGTNDSKEIEKSLALGAHAYVRKPYKRQQILDLIANIIQ